MRIGVNTRFGIGSSLLAVGAAIVMPSVAAAQAVETATPTIAEAEAISADNDAGEIIVTAQRREQRLQDVPISIAVVSGDLLQERNITNFEQLGPLVPNLTVTKSPASNVIGMRGIASSAGSPSLEQSVVMFIDGIYAGNSRQFASPFLDIERIEVLRGPQGALVGKNTSAGAINIISRRPEHVFGGYINGTYDFTLDGPTIEGGVNIPLADGLAMRVVGKYSDVGGYIYNTVTDREDPSRRELLGRVSLVYETGPVNLFAKYQRGDLDVAGTPLQVRSALRGRGVDYVKETRLGFSEEFDDLRTDNAVFQADFRLGEHVLTSITGYSGFVNRNRVDADFFEDDLASADFDMDFEQWSQEIRLVSPTGGTLEYILGAYYQDSSLLEERTTGVLFAPPASTYRIFDQDSRVISAYGQATINFSDQLSLTGSLRYTHERKVADYQRFAGPETYLPQRTGALVAQFSDRISEGLLDPSVSIQYRPSRNHTFYASYSSGSKGGGFQGAISNAEPFAFAFDPERSDSFEIGVKNSFPGVGYLNVAAFYTNYSDLQVSVSLPSPDGLSAPFFTGNAGDARVIGVELEGLARLSENFSIEGSLAWMPEANYREYTAGPCYPTQVPDGTQPGSCDLTGLRLIYAPEFSGSLTGRYRQDVGRSLRASASLTAIFQTDSLRDFTADPFARQDAYLKLDARIALGAIDDRWEIALIGRNLTNQRTITFASAGGLANTFFSPDARNFVIDLPRTIALSANFRF